MTKEFTTEAVGKKLTVKCDESLLPQAEALLKTIKQIAEKNGGLKNDEAVRVGWTVFTIKDNGGGLSIYEPDFKNNPLELNEDITQSLSVLVRQDLLLSRLGVQGQPVLYSEKVVCAKGVLDEEKIYLERSENIEKGDSGWYIGSVDDKDGEPELEAISVYQLLQRRPAVLSAFSLPPKFLTVFIGDKIDAVLNEQNQNIWN